MLASLALTGGALGAGADGTTTTSTGVSTSSTTTSSSSTTTSTAPTTTTSLVDHALDWPGGVSSAVAIPALSVSAGSSPQNVRPIASLTKMMTAWVVLQHLPLGLGQRGPCHVVTAHDLAVYRYDVATGQSSAAVAVGEQLCEKTLMTGLMVHSAGNFAYILLEMMHIGQGRFVALMNEQARALGLTRTHYVDPTGIDPRDTSTAMDQAAMATTLMASSPLIRSIVQRPAVRLPVAGVLGSYTPLVGQFGVVGVKSGFTFPAGGCDVMAVHLSVGGIALTTYAVVLGEHGANPLAESGEAALNLSHSLRRFIAVRTLSSVRQLVWTGAPSDVATTTTTVATTTTTSTTTTVPSGPPTGTTTTVP